MSTLVVEKDRAAWCTFLPLPPDGHRCTPGSYPALSASVHAPHSASRGTEARPASPSRRRSRSDNCDCISTRPLVNRSPAVSSLGGSCTPVGHNAKPGRASARVSHGALGGSRQPSLAPSPERDTTRESPGNRICSGNGAVIQCEAVGRSVTPAAIRRASGNCNQGRPHRHEACGHHPGTAVYDVLRKHWLRTREALCPKPSRSPS